MSRAGTGVTPQNPRGLKDLPFELPAVEASAKRRARAIHKALEERYPDAHCALDYSSPHELLIGLRRNQYDNVKISVPEDARGEFGVVVQGKKREFAKIAEIAVE